MDLISKKVLLTGVTGFLGSYLLEALLSHGYEVIVLKRTFSNTWRIKHLLDKVQYYDIDVFPLENIFECNKVDVIIHSATNYGRANDRLLSVIDGNFIFPLRLLELALDYKVNIFFNADTLLDRKLNYYTLSKKQFTEWLEIFSQKIQIINFNIDYMYGPGDDISRFIPWVIYNFYKNTPEIDLTKGNQKRNFIYIYDVVNAFTVLLNNNVRRNYEDLDLTSDNKITIKEIVMKIKDVISSLLNREVLTELNFGALPYRERELMDIKTDNNKLKQKGWFPNTSLDDGLKFTIEWYINSIEKGLYR